MNYPGESNLITQAFRSTYNPLTRGGRGEKDVAEGEVRESPSVRRIAMSLLDLRCRDTNAEIEGKPPGNNSSSLLTASEETVTAILQPQGAGFHEQLE